MADVNAAAEAMGIPPELVSRSAAARAEASGTTTEEVLEAWSGGGSVAAKAPEPAAEEAEAQPPETEAPAPEPEAAPVEPPSIPDPAPPSEPAEPVPAPAAATGEPPVLVGVSDNPWTVVVGAALLFIAVALIALLGAAIPTDAPGARSSQIAFSEQALDGRDVYESLGCAGCHTQMIRPVVADVGIGPVTLSDTNQVLGIRRYGPDLADVGSRVSATQLQGIIAGTGGHPGHNLSEEDMSDLVAYLIESATSVEGGQG
ncbi:MAG: hypothetical protein DWQ40_11115 [Actinobacteria bacterium]|nr:MAG: hypothetical protein DWQ40_11115 [Actinomycetota bacterium]